MSKHLTGILAVAALATVSWAQETVAVALQGKTIEVKYAGAAMGGRKIFGAAVPYGQVWKIGDKTAPVFHTDADLAFYGLTVPKGDYTLYVLPAADKWQLIVSKQKSAGAYDPKLDVGRIPMTMAKTAAPVEACKLTLLKTAALSAKLELSWENTAASVPIRLDMANSDREW